MPPHPLAGKFSSRPSDTSSRHRGGWRSTVLGTSVAVVIAAVATMTANGLATVGAGFVSTVFVAIVLGIAVRWTVGLPEAWRPGINLAATRVLRMAIVLLGFRFTIATVLETGWSAIAVIVAVILTAFVVTSLVSWSLGVDRRLAVLIAVGTAICGNSAIAATAPVIDADDDEISFASTVITLFGTAAMLLYPFIGHLIGLDSEQFGFLAGAGIHDSAQAVASGFIYSTTAGDVATVVKLTRTGFLVPAVIAIGFFTRRQSSASESQAPVKVLPLFAVGFVVAALLRTIGDAFLGGVPAWTNLLDLIGVTAGFLLVVAMAAVGVNTHTTGLRRIGSVPLVVGLAASVLAGCVALLMTLLVK